MVFTESAKLMDANEIKQMMDDEYYANPTVERLVFLEPKPKVAEANSKIFPMFIESVGVSADKQEAFICCIMQTMNGEFRPLKVSIPLAEIGKKKRIWDKPPTKGLRENTPWEEEEEAR